MELRPLSNTSLLHFVVKVFLQFGALDSALGPTAVFELGKKTFRKAKKVSPFHLKSVFFLEDMSLIHGQI